MGLMVDTNVFTLARSFRMPLKWRLLCLCIPGAGALAFFWLHGLFLQDVRSDFRMKDCDIPVGDQVIAVLTVENNTRQVIHVSDPDFQFYGRLRLDGKASFETPDHDFIGSAETTLIKVDPGSKYQTEYDLRSFLGALPAGYYRLSYKVEVEYEREKNAADHIAQSSDASLKRLGLRPQDPIVISGPANVDVLKTVVSEGQLDFSVK
jgi:hypothetical protein